MQFSVGLGTQTRAFFPALILYASTLFFASYFVEVALLSIFLVVSLVINANSAGLKIKRLPFELVTLLSAYVILSIIYVFWKSDHSLVGSNPVLGVTLLTIMVVSSGLLSKDVLYVFLILCAFESILAVGQYISGTPYFFDAQLVGRESLNSSDIYGLYSEKVLGLGYSSTQLSAKIIFALCAFIGKGGKPSTALLAILMAGSLVTFSRAGVLSLSIIVFYLFYARGLIHKFFAVTSAVLVLILFYNYLETIFLKNNEFSSIFSGELDFSVILTGRLDIWRQAWDFWLHNFVFGGVGVSQAFEKVNGEANAHNTFLYILSKGGIFLLIPYLLIMIAIARKVPFLVFISLLLFSTFGSMFGSYLSYYEVIIFSLLYPSGKGRSISMNKIDTVEVQSLRNVQA
ncbi:O-antigen ligase like membrane protein [Marinobacter sp. es.042]|uniref:O-antigen ligase family protein n=1 Tax=Marinobacter sp. es.042 TaxID=1761794 RepID=UPI000B5075C1|nr:O-antigen ligase family protein [Marinobacter sp. es.042]SNB54886.1 O-antigen ligase like membrane protein [Marinobacter sp. es.042]